MSEDVRNSEQTEQATKAIEPGGTDLTDEELEQVAGGESNRPPLNPCCS